MRWIDNKNIAIILSQKSDGDMLFKNGNQLLNEEVELNRQRFFQKNNIDPLRVVNIAGVHGNFTYIIKQENLGNGALKPETRIKDADGLITNIKNSYLMVTGADCFPLFFYDGKNQVIGIAHAGWRGILKEIAPKVISKLKNNFNPDSSDINVWIGPGIKKCHFYVKEDMIELFRNKYSDYIENKNGQFHIDLPAIIKYQLIESGINPKNIVEYPNCTYCQKEKWFSYRRDKPEYPEAAAFIMELK